MPLPIYVQEAVDTKTGLPEDQETPESIGNDLFETSETSLPDYVTKAVTEKLKNPDTESQELDPTAPEWMKDSPFLAGLYGAGKGILEQAVAPAIEGVGMVAGSLGSPLVGTALGYGAARQLNDYLIDSYKRFGGEDPKVLTVSEEMLQSAADVGSVLVIGGLMNTGAKLAPIMEDYLFHSLPKRLYGSAIKTPMSKKWIQTLPNEVASKQTAAVEEGLSSRISPSEYGLSKIKNLEKEALEYIDDITKILSKDPSKAISREAVLEKGLEKAYSKASKSSDPIGAKAYVDAIANRFKAHPKNLTPANANQIKRQLYEEVKYGGSEPSGLSAQLNSVGKKGVAREIMLNLEEVYPPLAQLNATDAARINLVEAIERTFAKEAQKSLVPLGAKILMRPKTWPLAIWEGTVGHPQVKTRLAFALHKANPVKYPAKPSSYTPPPLPPKPSKPQKPFKYTPPEQGFVQPHKPMDLPKVESPNAISLPTSKYTPDQLHKMLKSKDISQTEMAVQDIIDTRKKVEISERERIQTINDMLNKFKGDK